MRLLIAIISAATAVAQTTQQDAVRSAMDLPSSPPIIKLFDLAGPSSRIGRGWVPPKGPLARVVEANYRVRGPYPELEVLDEPELTGITIFEFDAENREVRNIDSKQQIVVRSSYVGALLSSIETLSTRNAQEGQISLRQFLYKDAGRIAEVRSDYNGRFQNRFADFHYDGQDRLEGLAFYQSQEDQLFSRTEFHRFPDSADVEEAQFTADGEFLLSQRNSFDQAGKIVQTLLRNRETTQKNSPIEVTFRYDSKGRLLEQKSMTPPLHPTDEHDVLPGVVSLQYDDAQNSRALNYQTDGTSLTANTRFDAVGNPIEIEVTVNGQLRQHVAWDCAVDRRGNWTECRQYTVQGNQRSIQGMWRRIITYRN